MSFRSEKILFAARYTTYSCLVFDELSCLPLGEGAEHSEAEGGYRIGGLLMKTRGFEKVAKYMNVEFPMPERKTQFSAGYDISAAEEVVLEPGKLVLVPTGVKAYMQTGEFLGLHIRSSMAVKKHLMLVNNVGIIDADYYNNADNEGHIMVALMNMGTEAVTIPQGERIAQGIFYNYLTVDDDDKVEKAVRGGGFGSTGK